MFDVDFERGCKPARRAAKSLANSCTNNGAEERQLQNHGQCAHPEGDGARSGYTSAPRPTMANICQHACALQAAGELNNGGMATTGAVLQFGNDIANSS